MLDGFDRDTKLWSGLMQMCFKKTEVSTNEM
jgi:hypothetical protein